MDLFLLRVLTPLLAASSMTNIIYTDTCHWQSGDLGIAGSFLLCARYFLLALSPKLLHVGLVKKIGCQPIR
jgi:hypothetical protein